MPEQRCWASLGFRVVGLWVKYPHLTEGSKVTVEYGSLLDAVPTCDSPTLLQLLVICTMDQARVYDC